MNERIRKLAIETDAWCDQHYLGDQFYDLKWEQKFAELIIEECATVIERNLFQGIGWNTSRAVKQHFGIGIEE